jgi:siroheme synthase (precorrin-2 oxidase/ferrochelatase)
VLSSTIRKSIEKAVPDYYGRLSVELGSWREELKERVASADLRKKMFRALTLRGIEQKGRLDRGDFEQIIKEIGEDKE